MTRGAPRHRLAPAKRHAPGRPPTTLFLAALFTGACGAFAWTAGAGALPVSTQAPAPRVELAAAAPSQPSDDAPARIDIDRIGVSTNVEALVRNSNGTMATPHDWNDVGWYAEGVRPGRPGPAILVGHRDSAADGPAVFFRLGELSPGDQLTVTEKDGTAHRFAVVALEQVAKSAFPTGEVYGPSTQSLLRIITCTGGFDYDARSYLDNLVVTAREV
jgi:sortase family protein